LEASPSPWLIAKTGIREALALRSSSALWWGLSQSPSPRASRSWRRLVDRLRRFPARLGGRAGGSCGGGGVGSSCEDGPPLAKDESLERVAEGVSTSATVGGRCSLGGARAPRVFGFSDGLTSPSGFTAFERSWLWADGKSEPSAPLSFPVPAGVSGPALRKSAPPRLGARGRGASAPSGRRLKSGPVGLAHGLVSAGPCTVSCPGLAPGRVSRYLVAVITQGKEEPLGDGEVGAGERTMSCPSTRPADQLPIVGRHGA